MILQSNKLSISSLNAHGANSHTAARQTEAGSALVYILIAIALLAALTVSFMGSSGQQAQSQNTFKATAELKSQVEFIRTSVQECLLIYPGGDPGVWEDEPNADHRYPIAPDSDYFDEPASGRLVRDLRCPGDHPSGDVKNHARIFSGASGKFMLPIPDMFEPWQWYNGIDGIFFWTSSNKSDAFIQDALERLEENFDTCEADLINATSSAQNMDSESSVSCSSGSLCFRVWMRPANSSAVFPDKDECED